MRYFFVFRKDNIGKKSFFWSGTCCFVPKSVDKSLQSTPERSKNVSKIGDFNAKIKQRKKSSLKQRHAHNRPPKVIF